MIRGNKVTTRKIQQIWDDYVHSDKIVVDTKGRVIDRIDEERLRAILDIKEFIYRFKEGKIDLYEFKTILDSYNKKNNLWGFTAAKGQMFFNLIVKSSDANIDALSELIKTSIAEPSDLAAALEKIERLEKYVTQISALARDKRKVPNPASSGYFLSYFWQIHSPEQWPILYTSMLTAFKELGFWANYVSQKDNYERFYQLNEEIKGVLEEYAQTTVSNWGVEHMLWSYKGNPHIVLKKEEEATASAAVSAIANVDHAAITVNFNKNDYLIPKIARLVELGNDADKAGPARGSEYEKMVAEIFRQLDFEVDLLGQGKGRTPDAIIKYPEDHIAFIVDAKAYQNGYSLGLDDRAIKEYISHYCPVLKRQGYTKIGFIIVSNSFKSNLENFINDITWETEIRRFVLLTSEALLYLLAYKTKDKLSIHRIIDCIISSRGIISTENVIGQFEDI